MGRVFVCLCTVVLRFVRVRRCQTDGVRAELRTDNHVVYDHVNHERRNDYHDYHDDGYYNRNILVCNNIDHRKARAGR